MADVTFLPFHVEQFLLDGYYQRAHVELGSGTGEGAVTQADKFWNYAREAILAAYEAKSDEDKQGLIELSHAWTRAALLDRLANAA